jgi:hypothetical protein
MTAAGQGMLGKNEKIDNKAAHRKQKVHGARRLAAI